MGHDDAATGPYVVSAAADWDPTSTLSVELERTPPPQPTLGNLSAGARVDGPAQFPLTMLRSPVRGSDVVGIDPTTVRFFWWDDQARTFRPIWRSGLNLELGLAWAEIRRPGLYLPIGLPRDSVLRDMLRMLARERSFAHTDSPDEHQSFVQRAFAPLLDRPAAELDRMRQVAACIEFQTGQELPGDKVRLGKGGEILPLPLPGDRTVNELRELISTLQPGPNGFPEEHLLSAPEDQPLHRLTEAAVSPAFTGLEAVAGRLNLTSSVSTDWPMYHHDPQRTGAASGVSDIRSTTAGRLRSRFVVSLDGPVIAVPVVVQGKIYIGTGNSTIAADRSGGTLYRLDAGSGAIDKTFTFNTPLIDEGHNGGSRQGYAGIGSSPAVVDGRVYFSGLDGKLYCLDATTLSPIWITDLRHADPAHNQPVRHTVSAEGWSSPLVVNGRVYVGFGEGESETFGFVYCLDARNGHVIWLFCTNRFEAGVDNRPNLIPDSAVAAPLLAGFESHADPPDSGVSVWSSCSYDPGLNRILVGTGNSTAGDFNPMPDPFYGSGVLALDADTGALRGYYQPAPEDSYRSTDLDVDIPASPTIFTQDGMHAAAIGSKSGAFVILDPNTMTPLAKRQLLPFDRGGDPLPNVDPDNGGELHENKSGVFGTAAFHATTGRLFIGLGGYSQAIDSPTTPFMRAIAWRTLADAWATAGDNPPKYVLPVPPMYTTAGEAGLSSPAVVNDVVFAGTTKPGFYAFSVETGVPLWAADDLGNPAPGNYIVGSAISGNLVVLGQARGRSNGSVHIYSL